MGKRLESVKTPTLGRNEEKQGYILIKSQKQQLGKTLGSRLEG